MSLEKFIPIIDIEKIKKHPDYKNFILELGKNSKYKNIFLEEIKESIIKCEKKDIKLNISEIIKIAKKNTKEEMYLDIDYKDPNTVSFSSLNSSLNRKKKDDYDGYTDNFDDENFNDDVKIENNQKFSEEDNTFKWRGEYDENYYNRTKEKDEAEYWTNKNKKTKEIFPNLKNLNFKNVNFENLKNDPYKASQEILNDLTPEQKDDIFEKWFYDEKNPYNSLADLIVIIKKYEKNKWIKNEKKENKNIIINKTIFTENNKENKELKKENKENKEFLKDEIKNIYNSLTENNKKWLRDNKNNRQDFKIFLESFKKIKNNNNNLSQEKLEKSLNFIEKFRQEQKFFEINDLTNKWNIWGEKKDRDGKVFFNKNGEPKIISLLNFNENIYNSEKKDFGFDKNTSYEELKKIENILKCLFNDEHTYYKKIGEIYDDWNNKKIDKNGKILKIGHLKGYLQKFTENKQEQLTKIDDFIHLINLEDENLKNQTYKEICSRIKTIKKNSIKISEQITKIQKNIKDIDDKINKTEEEKINIENQKKELISTWTKYRNNNSIVNYIEDKKNEKDFWKPKLKNSSEYTLIWLKECIQNVKENKNISLPYFENNLEQEIEEKFEEIKKNFIETTIFIGNKKLSYILQLNKIYCPPNSKFKAKKEYIEKVINFLKNKNYYNHEHIKNTIENIK